MRVLEFVGHEVIRQNHLGDWGTPFGMLIEHLLSVGEAEAADELSVGDLGRFYQEARAAFDADPDFADRARRRVVELQAGDPQTLRLWKLLVDESSRYFSAVYERLGVKLTPDDQAGESMYNPLLADTMAELDRLGLLVESDGALCVFPPGFTTREGKPLPLIVRKSDGGFGYDTTDLAAIRYRLRDLGADHIIYVVGAPQREHLEMIIEAARLAGWLEPPARAEHVAFGSVLGADRKMFRTRAGGSIRLVDLLDEAVERAGRGGGRTRPTELCPEEQAAVSEAVGIGAVKYADLSNDRVKDYVFDWDRMLDFTGQHGAVPAVRPRPGPVDLPQGRSARASTSPPWPRRTSSTPPNGAWRWSCCRSTGRCTPRRSRSSPTGSARTSSTWPRPSPTSTRAARSCGPTPRASVRSHRLFLADLTGPGPGPGPRPARASPPPTACNCTSALRLHTVFTSRRHRGPHRVRDDGGTK